MKRVIIIVLLFGTVLSTTVYGQQQDLLRLYHRTSALTHPDYPSNNVGIEVFPMRSNFSILGEVGFLFEPGWAEEDFRNSRKYYLEARYFIGEGKTRSFAGLTWHRRDVTTFSNYTIGFDCDLGDERDCARYEDFTGNVSATLNAFQLNLGSQTNLNDWLYVEGYVGLGQGNHKLDRSSINGGQFVERGRLWQERSFGRNRLQFTMTFKVGLRMDTVLDALRKDKSSASGG